MIHGEAVTHRIDLTDLDVPVDDLVVWASLPRRDRRDDVTDLGCADCGNPGDSNYPDGLDVDHADRGVLL